MTTATGETRVFRGASLEEILPRIREELGPDAVVVREREGLVGGIAGFFARRCIEVEAAPGWPTGHDDVVLTLPAQDAAESYAAAAPLEIGGPGIEPGVNSFMEALLDRAAALDELFVPTAAGPEASVPASTPMQVSAPPRQVEVATPPLEPRPRTSRRLIEEVAAPAADAFAETEAGVRIDLRRSGMSESAIDRVLVTVRNHLHPLSPTAGLRESARLAVRSSIATPVGWRDRRTIGFAGLDDAAAARAVATLAAALDTTEARVAVVALGARGQSLARMAARLVDADIDLIVARDVHDVERAKADAAEADVVLAVSTSVRSDDKRSAVASASLLLALDPDETHLVLPLRARPERVNRALDRLDPFIPVDCLMPSSAGIVEDLGAAVGVALERRLAFRWLLSAGPSVRVHAADAALLAEAVLP